MKKLGSKFISYLLVIALFVGALYFTMALETPLGAKSVTEGTFDQTANYSNYAPDSITAIAGNITNLTIEGISQTKHWQGFFGEITGTIVLDDADNYTMYEWSDTEPEGEIYAAINSSIDWETIACFNMSGLETGSGNNNTKYWEDYFNMTYDDADGIDETFEYTNHDAFAVGEQTISAGDCYNIHTYAEDEAQTDKWDEILLQDQYGSIVFSTIIENDDEGNSTDPIGYSTTRHDFQLIVAEDGSSWSGGSRNTDTTTYYFYVDLE